MDLVKLLGFLFSPFMNPVGTLYLLTTKIGLIDRMYQLKSLQRMMLSNQPKTEKN